MSQPSRWILVLCVFLLPAAASAGISHTTGGEVRVPAGATVDGVSVVGGSAVVGDGARINGDIEVVGGEVTLGRDVVVTGDVDVVGGEVTLFPGARIEGTVETLGAQVVRLGGTSEASAVVASGGASVAPAEPPSFFTRATTAVTGLASEMASTTLWHAALLIIGLILVGTLPRPFDKMRRPLETRPGAALLTGAGVFFFSVPLVLALTFTGIGLLAVPLVVAAYAVLALCGFLVAAQTIGRRYLDERPSLRALFAGSVLLWVVALVADLPWVGVLGGIVLAAATLMGAGAVALALIESRQQKPATLAF